MYTGGQQGSANRDELYLVKPRPCCLPIGWPLNSHNSSSQHDTVSKLVDWSQRPLKLTMLMLTMLMLAMLMLTMLLLTILMLTMLFLMMLILTMPMLMMLMLTLKGCTYLASGRHTSKFLRNFLF